MTTQLVNTQYGRSKKALQAALDASETRAQIRFYDPSITKPRVFAPDAMQLGESITVVMDRKTRRRFAEVTRRTDGSYKVS